MYTFLLLLCTEQDVTCVGHCPLPALSCLGIRPEYFQWLHLEGCLQLRLFSTKVLNGSPLRQNWILGSIFFLLPFSLHYLGLLIQQLSLAIVALLAKCDSVGIK